MVLTREAQLTSFYHRPKTKESAMIQKVGCQI